MGYELHIVRTEQWSGATAIPITKAEVEQLIAPDSSLSWSTTDYVEMKTEDGTVARVYYINWNEDPVFLWRRSEITCKNPDAAQTLKLAQMAAALGAVLLGDDGERYELGKTLFGKPKVTMRKS
jgi:hypothetical protein